MDGGAWWATVHGVSKNQTRLSDFTFTFPFPLSTVPLLYYHGYYVITIITTYFLRSFLEFFFLETPAKLTYLHVYFGVALEGHPVHYVSLS